MTDDAFRGLKLSSPAVSSSLQPVDQRLFGRPPSKPKVTHWRDRVQGPSDAGTAANRPNESESGRSGDQLATATHEGKRETRPEAIPLERARIERPLLEPTVKELAPFDINAKPHRKDSFLFTNEEFDRLDDLKLELRRRLDLNATKNDIARVAFQVLFEDYGREPEKSAVVRHLRKKKP
jgi:hypothetical protein